MAVLVASVCGSTEGSLESEAIYQIELAPHDNSRRAFTSLLHDEVAAWEAEIFRVLTK